MKRQVHTGSVRANVSSWTQFVAVLCLLLFACTSVAQASHTHGSWALHAGSMPSIGADQTNPIDSSTNEVDCQLCIAMHLVLPTAIAFISLLALFASFLVLARRPKLQSSLWHFSLFSRPPPVAL